MAISKRLRYEILRRDNHACRYCGATAPDTTLTVDHVVPVALGGSDEPSNLVTACSECNSGKSSMPADANIVEDVESDAIRWAKALEQAVEVDRAKRTKDDEFVTEVVRKFANGSPVFNALDKDYARTLLMFRDLGLGLDDMDYALSQMLGRGLFGKSRWKYFCGVCWSIIKERQQTARMILDSEEGES